MSPRRKPWPPAFDIHVAFEMKAALNYAPILNSSRSLCHLDSDVNTEHCALGLESTPALDVSGY